MSRARKPGLRDDKASNESWSMVVKSVARVHCLEGRYVQFVHKNNQSKSIEG